MSKAAGVLGGIFTLLGVLGFFFLWVFHYKPLTEISSSYSMLFTIYLGDLLGVWVSGINWSLPFLPGVTLGDWLLINVQIVTMPITSVNFWNVFRIDTTGCIVILTAITAVGSILAFTGPEYY
jgi:hypothetical protein